MTNLQVKYFNASQNLSDVRDVINDAPEEIGEIMLALKRDELYASWVIEMENC